jgi:uncharacterized protein (TIGR02453 family)
MNKEVFEFLSDLEQNNNREWFAQNKKRYEDVKKTLEQFVTKLILNINSFDASINIMDASKTLFRIYRDIRFSSNKDPYKTNLGSIIVPDSYRKSWDYPGYYLHLQNDNCFITMGIYMPTAPALKQLRHAIDEDFEPFSGILTKLEQGFGGLLHQEDALKRVPPGFDKNSPAAEYLKLKNFYVFKGFSNKEVLEKDFLEKITSLFRSSFELKEWFVETLKE